MNDDAEHPDLHGRKLPVREEISVIRRDSRFVQLGTAIAHWKKTAWSYKKGAPKSASFGLLVELFQIRLPRAIDIDALGFGFLWNNPQQINAQQPIGQRCILNLDVIR